MISPLDYASYFQIWLDDDEEIRRVDFNARGQYANAIGNDALYDMLRQEKVTRQGVFVGVYGHKWQLFELRRQPQVGFPVVAYDDRQGESAVTFHCQLRQPWEGRFTFQILSLDRPLSQPQKLSETTRLERVNRIPCTLAPGSYLLEILNEGEPLSLNQMLMRFTVGASRTKIGFRSASSLLKYLREEKKEIVPKELAADYVQIMLSELEQIDDPVELLTPTRRFHLACLPINSYEGSNLDHLAKLWAPLAQICEAHRIAKWEEEFGLLPAWAVLNQPMRMKLGPFGEASIKVYPERSLIKGQTGIGYADLKFDMDAIHTTRVYAGWSSDSGKVTARFGLPNDSPKEAFAELDELDLRPVYFCLGCGRLIGKRGNITPDDPLVKRHFHGRENPQFGDIFVDSLNESLPAELWPQRRKEVLQYTYQPSMTIDRTVIASYFDGIDQQPTEVDSNPISRQSYRHATGQWLTRYHASDALRIKLNSFIENQHWQTSLRMLSKRLVEYGYETRAKVLHEPLYKASGRFLSGFTGAGGSEHRDLIELDRNVAALAFILRAFSYYPSRTKSLIKQVRLKEDDLVEMLDIFWQVCPELFSWSLTWTELFYIHAVS